MIAMLVAGSLGFAGVASSQTTAPAAADPKPAAKPEAKPDAKGDPKPAAKAEKPAVYHGGGKHDQKGHEAAVKAKATGQKMEEPAVHAGGKHDEQSHKSAIKADQGAAAPAEAPAKK